MSSSICSTKIQPEDDNVSPLLGDNESKSCCSAKSVKNLGKTLKTWGKKPVAKLALAALVVMAVVGAIALGIHLGMGFEQFGHWFNQSAIPWLEAHAVPLEIAAGGLGGFALGALAVKSVSCIQKAREKRNYNIDV